MDPPLFVLGLYGLHVSVAPLVRRSAPKFGMFPGVCVLCMCVCVLNVCMRVRAYHTHTHTHTNVHHEHTSCQVVSLVDVFDLVCAATESRVALRTGAKVKRPRQ